MWMFQASLTWKKESSLAQALKTGKGDQTEAPSADENNKGLWSEIPGQRVDLERFREDPRKSWLAKILSSLHSTCF